MKKVLFAAILAVSPICAASAETVRGGLIAPFSGPFAIYGMSWQEAIDVYRKQHGDSVVRDLSEANPSQAKALARELLIGCHDFVAST